MTIEMVIPKRYCIDYESDIEKTEVEIVNNKIKCQDIGVNFYKIYIWQQLLVNEIFKKNKTVILEVEYVDSDFTKVMEIKNKFEIPKERSISNQCSNCKFRVSCENYQEALTKDYVLSTDNPEKLYNTYVAVGGRIEAMNGIYKELREKLEEEISKAKDNKLILGKMGLTLSLKEIQRDDFPFDIALKEKLLTNENCKIKISELKKTIKGTEYEKYLKKVPWQKRLNVD
jgi:hypothetical protein